MRTVIFLLVLGAIASFIAPSSLTQYDSHVWIGAVVAVAGLALSAYQAYESSQQAKEARELADTPQPIQKMPKQMQQALRTSGYLASLSKAPGSVYEQAYSEQLAAQQFDESKDFVRTSSQAQGLLENKYTDLAQAQRQRESASLQFQAGMKQNLTGVQLAAANKQSDLDTTNIMEPYYRRLAASSALRQASEANKWGAINNAFGVASQFAAGQVNNQGTQPNNTTNNNDFFNYTDQNFNFNGNNQNQLKTPDVNYSGQNQYSPGYYQYDNRV